MRMSRLVNAIEQSIHMGITRNFLMVEGDWYLIRKTYAFRMHIGGNMDSMVYHSRCAQMRHQKDEPIMHWKEHRCQGCLRKAPDNIIAAYVLHNFDNMAEATRNANRV